MQQTSAYPNPDILVETAWLAGHLQDADIRVVDCDTRDAFRRAHIPGAVSPREHYMKAEGDPLHIMGPEQFARELGEMGIGDGTLVVCYDGFGSLYSARFWWCLRYYGHDRAVAVNGGWQKWLSEGRPITYKETKPAPATFTPKPREDVVCRVDGLKAASTVILSGAKNLEGGRGGPVIWDVRSEAEWTGANNRGNKRAGHIPGAVHLEWLNTVTKDDFQTVKPAAELRALLDQLGITPEQEVVTY